MKIEDLLNRIGDPELRREIQRTLYRLEVLNEKPNTDPLTAEEARKISQGYREKRRLRDPFFRTFSFQKKGLWMDILDDPNKYLPLCEEMAGYLLPEVFFLIREEAGRGGIVIHYEIDFNLHICASGFVGAGGRVFELYQALAKRLEDRGFRVEIMDFSGGTRCQIRICEP